MKPAALPSIPGCAFGFGCIGWGLGACIGTGLTGTQAEVDAVPMEQKFGVMYNAAFYGMGIGIICGALVGVAYAKIVIHFKK
jgi:hypothetical protein